MVEGCGLGAFHGQSDVWITCGRDLFPCDVRVVSVSCPCFVRVMSVSCPCLNMESEGVVKSNAAGPNTGSLKWGPSYIFLSFLTVCITIYATIGAHTL
jgi:hypothetical protein